MKRLAIALCLLLAFAPFADAKDVRIAGATLTVTDAGGGGVDPWTPNLPQLNVDTTLPTGWDGTADATPANGAALETALANVNQNAGHPWVIQLTAGATYTTATAGGFKIPNKTGSQELVIRTSGYAGVPAGTRVVPGDVADMAKIKNTGTDSAIWFEAGAHNVRFIGIEVTTDYAVRTSSVSALVYCGYNNDTGLTPTSESDLPSYVTFDRCYMHGTSTGNIRRALWFDVKYGAVIDSYLSDFHDTGADSQALFASNSPGPFKIDNNYLEGAGENIMFGGRDPTITNCVPSDITFTRNHVFKPLTWYFEHGTYAGILWSVKNNLELKNARRILIEGNVFQNNWAGQGQSGYAIVFTPRNQSGGANWSTVRDVTCRKNKITNTCSGFQILNQDNDNTSEPLLRVLIKDNLLLCDGENLGGSATFFLFSTPVTSHNADYIEVNHNTCLHLTDGHSAAQMNDVPLFATNFRMRNGIYSHGLYGFVTASGQGTPGLAAFTTSYDFTYNALVLDGATQGTYPATNLFPADPTACSFTNYAGGDYSITSGSLNNAAGDSTDFGADIAALNTAISGVE